MTTALTTGLSEGDRRALWRSMHAIERESFLAKVARIAGEPLAKTLGQLPKPLAGQVNRAVTAALRQALDVALYKMEAKSSSARKTGFQVISGLTGTVGGFFGMPALAVELPVTTTLMLRSIAAIARQEGEDLRHPEARLACLEVFALGRDGPPHSETTYYATRAFLARTTSEITRTMAERGATAGSVPLIVEFISGVASRFGLVVSEKVLAGAIPVVGALGGAAVNLAFMEYFQRLAGAHFTIRRLERVYGKDEVQQEYRALLPHLKS